jgi:hypothetical protein
VAETDWNSRHDLDSMVREVSTANRDGARVSRLFASACGRLVWRAFSKRLGRPSVEIGEKVADGRADWGELRREFLRIRRAPPPTQETERAVYEASIAILMLFEISVGSAGVAARQVREIARLVDHEDLNQPQCDLLRDLFGDPSRPLPYDPGWSSPRVAELARSIYEARDFDAMPMLGDALEDAGCDGPEVLDHCRRPGNHARGCWVVDCAMGLR